MDLRERNMIYHRQNMNFDSVRPELSLLENMRYAPPTSDSDVQLFSEASRKRKAMDLDLGSFVNDGISPNYWGNLEGHMGSSLQREYTAQHNVVMPHSLHSQLGTAEVLLNHNSHSSKPSNAELQYGNFQFHNVDNSLWRSGTGTNIRNAALSNSFPSFSFHHKESSFLTKIPAGENSGGHDSQHPVCETATVSEPSKFLPFSIKGSGCTEVSQAISKSISGKNLAPGNYNLLYNPSLYPCSVPSENVAMKDSSHLMAANESFHSDGGPCALNFIKSGLIEMKTNDWANGREEGRNISIGTTNSTQTSSVSEGTEAHGFFQNHNNELRYGNFIGNDSLGPRFNSRDDEQSRLIMPRMRGLRESSSFEQACLNYQIQNSNTHVSKDFETKDLEKDDGSNNEHKGHPLGDGTSPKSDNNLARGPVESGDGLTLNCLEQSKPVAGKVSPTVTDKLWEGLLQLNTSTTVFAVAFFKSGEKAQDINWSEHVEIKGKVRLHAFEKFIQELPRSRNRALMVISLCWKVGSSNAGLIGMKEVAKGYRESERVGFAQICPGIDLYVCPRSETIITILAKYGFFKGMAAVEEDQDSLIGCVVWRRGQPPLNSAPKSADTKKTTLPEQPLNSPESSVPDTNSPIPQVHDSESKPERAHASFKSECTSTPLDNALPLLAQSKVVEFNDNSSHGASGSYINSDYERTLAFPYNSPLAPVQPPTSQEPDSTPLQETMRNACIPIDQAPESNSPDLNVEPLPPILSKQPQMLRGFQQQTDNQFSYSSHNPASYSSSHVPELTSAPDLLLVKAQRQMTQEPGLGSRHSSLRSDSEAELRHTALPGPPPLPADVLKRLIQFSRDAHKGPLSGLPKSEIPPLHIRELEKPTAGFEAQPRSANSDDNDDDLPEFDFDSACGVPKAPVGKFPWSSNQPHFPDAASFNKQLQASPSTNGMEGAQKPEPLCFPSGPSNTAPASKFPWPSHQAHFPAAPSNEKLPVGVVKNESRPVASPTASVMEVAQRSQGFPFPTEHLDSFQGLNTFRRAANTPTKYQELIDEEKPNTVQASHWPPKRHWNNDDDDDDMPEWCPPDLDPLEQRKVSASTRRPPPIPNPVSQHEIPRPPQSASFHLPPQRQHLHHEYQPGLLGPRPASVNPAPVHARPDAGFDRSDPRPSQTHLNHRSRPSTTNFNNRPPNSNGSRRWRRH